MTTADTPPAVLGPDAGREASGSTSDKVISVNLSSEPSAGPDDERPGEDGPEQKRAPSGTRSPGGAGDRGGVTAPGGVDATVRSADLDGATGSAPALVPAPTSPRLRNLLARVGTAVVLGPLLLLALYAAPSWVFELIVLAGIAGASGELMGMALPDHRVAQGVGVAGSLAVAAVILHPFPGAPVVLLAGLAVGGVLTALAAARPVETAAFRLGWLIAGPVYVGGLLAPLVLLHRMPGGGSWVLLAMLLAWLGDTGAYFAGWRFGRTRLAPLISPGKTLEGSLGGLVGSVLGAVLASVWYLPSIRLLEAVGLGLLAGSLGQVGDLGESLLKRSTGVKDSGAALPGHGGLLDRVDALMMTGVVVWAFAHWG